MSARVHPLAAVLGAVLQVLDVELERQDHGEASRDVRRIREWERTQAGRRVDTDLHHEG